MSLSRLSSNSALNLAIWGQLTKVSSATPSAALVLQAAPTLPVRLTSITSSSTTATVTCAAAHGLATGDKVTIAGASLANYNGTFAVTVTGATTFTYVMAGTATSPAVGNPLASMLYFGKGIGPGGGAITTLTQSGNVATLTSTDAHGQAVGDVIQVKNASVSDFNGIFTVLAVTSTTVFTYTTRNFPTSPAIARASFLTYAVPQLTATKMIINADSGNAASVSIGPDSNANFVAIPAGTGYLIVSPPDKVLDLSGWYFKSASASQTVTLIYL